jgi:hypothetical protein
VLCTCKSGAAVLSVYRGLYIRITLTFLAWCMCICIRIALCCVCVNTLACIATHSESMQILFNRLSSRLRFYAGCSSCYHVENTTPHMQESTESEGIEFTDTWASVGCNSWEALDELYRELGLSKAVSGPGAQRCTCAHTHVARSSPLHK